MTGDGMKWRKYGVIMVAAMLLKLVVGCGNLQPLDNAEPAEQIRLAPLFQDGMVLQRDTELKIWGWCEPGRYVMLEFIGNKYRAVADRIGRWEVKIPPLPSCGPVVMKISGKTELKIKDVMLGEVWIAVGDNGLSIPLSRCPDGLIAARRAELSPLRFFQLSAEDNLADGLNGRHWQRCSPAIAPDLSGLGFYFGRDLFLILNIPVGVIVLPRNGASLISWQSGPARQQTLDLAVPYACRGILWAQCNPTDRDGSVYRRQFAELVASWRRDWQRDLFFLVAQLPRCEQQFPMPQTDSIVAPLREGQHLEASGIADAATVVTIDQELNGEHYWSNPATVGSRLALTAVDKIHKMVLLRGKKLVSGGPVFSSMKVNGNKATIRFKDVAGSLKTNDGKALRHFAVSGRNGHFYWANAAITGKDTVEVWSGKVTAPVAVRYAWADNPVANFYSRNGLPVVPFRTDDWPLSTDPANAPKPAQ